MAALRRTAASGRDRSTQAIARPSIEPSALQYLTGWPSGQKPSLGSLLVISAPHLAESDSRYRGIALSTVTMVMDFAPRVSATYKSLEDIDSASRMMAWSYSNPLTSRVVPMILL